MRRTRAPLLFSLSQPLPSRVVCAVAITVARPLRHTSLRTRRLRLPAVAAYKPSTPGPPEKSPFNRLLSSRRISIAFLILTGTSYIIALLLVARRLSFPVPPYQRILLLALGILLPDFRHVIKTYSEAVQTLNSYKPVFPFRVPKPREKDDISATDELPETPTPQYHPPHFSWFADALDSLQGQMRATLDDSAERLDAVITSLQRDVAKPIVQTGTQLQQFTVGTDLTLRKHVLIAASSLALSLMGYFVCASGEVIIGGVAIMMASLLASALLVVERHEVLILINDIRIVLSLVATLALVASAFIPHLSAYIFLICCVALVVLRYPIDWMRNL